MLIEFQLVSGKRIISSIFSFFFLVFLTHGNMQRFFHLLITLLIRQQLARQDNSNRSSSARHRQWRPSLQSIAEAGS
jgi:hypothetical protein